MYQDYEYEEYDSEKSGRFQLCLCSLGARDVADTIGYFSTFSEAEEAGDEAMREAMANNETTYSGNLIDGYYINDLVRSEQCWLP